MKRGVLGPLEVRKTLLQDFVTDHVGREIRDDHDVVLDDPRHRSRDRLVIDGARRKCPGLHLVHQVLVEQLIDVRDLA